jgi:hypothetical protein
MIEKVESINMVPDDIKELLSTGKDEFIVIGEQVYRLKPFGVKKYFELLAFISTYYTLYNDVFTESDNLKITKFFGNLAERLKDSGLIDEFMTSFFPEIKDAADEITKQQLDYLLGVIYKLNFLSKNLPIQNQEIRLSIHKMQEMLGLNLSQTTS